MFAMAGLYLDASSSLQNFIFILIFSSKLIKTQKSYARICPENIEKNNYQRFESSLSK